MVMKVVSMFNKAASDTYLSHTALQLGLNCSLISLKVDNAGMNLRSEIVGVVLINSKCRVSGDLALKEGTSIKPSMREAESRLYEGFLLGPERVRFAPSLSLNKQDPMLVVDVYKMRCEVCRQRPSSMVGNEVVWGGRGSGILCCVGPMSPQSVCFYSRNLC